MKYLLIIIGTVLAWSLYAMCGCELAFLFIDGKDGSVVLALLYGAVAYVGTNITNSYFKEIKDKKNKDGQ